MLSLWSLNDFSFSRIYSLAPYRFWISVLCYRIKPSRPSPSSACLLSVSWSSSALSECFWSISCICSYKFYIFCSNALIWSTSNILLEATAWLGADWLPKPSIRCSRSEDILICSFWSFTSWASWLLLCSSNSPIISFCSCNFYSICSKLPALFWFYIN